MGGIGNQLFQIIFAQKFASINDLKIEYCLDYYSIDGYKRKSVLHKLWPDAVVSSVPENSSNLLVQETDLDWPTCAGKLPQINVPNHISHVKLQGYWQDYRILAEEDIENILIRFKNSFTEEIEELYRIIKEDNNSTAVHIRRHDYKHHGLTKEKYYLDILKWLKVRFGTLNVLVFSDEPNYASEFLSSSDHNFQFVNTGDDLADLYIMSACNIQVIANSSYSWWSAVLSKSRLIFYPEPWSLFGNVSDYMCPKEWIKINNSVENYLASDTFLAQIDTEKFRVDKEKFISQSKLQDGFTLEDYPCLSDSSSKTDFDSHYVYHTSWAARKLLENKCELHFDIGSDIRFVTIASAFQKIEFLDFRPAHITLSNLSCGHADLTKLVYKDQSIKSISCMHVVEHIGLGRYGDEINYNGAIIAMQELQRVLASGGFLYFVVPVGRPTVKFNAHRIFDPKFIEYQFSELTLLEFSFVNDDGKFIENTNPTQAQHENYGCGCYLFCRN